MAKKSSRSTAPAKRKAHGEPLTAEDFVDEPTWRAASGYMANAGDPDPDKRRPSIEVYVSEMRKFQRGEELEFPNAVAHEAAE